ncbi:tyrosine-protein phosphatase [Nocardiopsis mangrovi]|uniref:Tyrosine-protein phosphatase n=1 Tax=Nocardiopsis mangrovi TaxID=1179818 RepID=A0ABV9DU25_9ACTN
MAFERLHDFRDLGGCRTSDGRTLRWGRPFRSDPLGGLRGDDGDRFPALGIGTVIDPRHPWEVERGGRVHHHPGLAHHHLSIEDRPYEQAGLDPGADPAPFPAERNSEAARERAAGIRGAREVIAGSAAPLAFHCHSGEDRVGVPPMPVLTLAGVGAGDIAADYALTGRAAERLVAQWRAGHPDLALGWAAYGTAPAETVHLFTADPERRYGSVRASAADHLGADDDPVAPLRTAPAPLLP